MIQPEFKHVIFLQKRARPIEKKEVRLISGKKFSYGMWDVMRQSRMSYTITVDGYTQGIGGFYPLSVTMRSYQPWLIMTKWPEKNRRLFWEKSLHYMRLVKPYVSYLQNYVLLENRWSQCWLRHLGFTMHDEKVVFAGHRWVKFSMDLGN